MTSKLHWKKSGILFLIWGWIIIIIIITTTTTIILLRFFLLLLLVKEVEKVELNRENQAVDELKQILIVLSLINPSKRPQNYKEG